MSDLPRSLLRSVTNIGIYIGAVLAFLLVVAAYQIRPSYDIAVGSPTDVTAVRNFNAAERMQGDTGQSFRWTSGDSYIVLEGVGAQDFDVTLTVAGSRPEGQPPASFTVEISGENLLDVQPALPLTDYHFSVPREKVHSGNLSLHLLSNAFSPQGDPRTLGVVMSRILVAPGSNPDRFIAPPLAVPFWIALAVGLFGLVLALLGWGVGGVLVGAGLISLLAAGLVIWDRLWLTSNDWYGIWWQTILAAAIFTAILWLIGRPMLQRLARRFTFDRTSYALHFRILLTLVFVVFAMRLAGQLHPQIFIVDLFYHVHRYEDAAAGKLIYMHVASELAGRDTFYLMTAYIFMMPLQWLIGDIPLTVRLFTVALSTAGAFLIYYLCASVLRNTRAGLIAASLYLTMPLSVLIFSWGLTTNVFAEFFALLLFTVFVLAPDLSPKKPAFWLLALLLFVGVLSHPAVVEILGFAVAVLCLIWFLAGNKQHLRIRAIQVAGAGILALVAAYLSYYRNIIPTMLETLADISGSQAEPGTPVGGDGITKLIGGAVKDKSLGLVIQEIHTYSEWFWGGLWGFWAEFWAYFKTWPLIGALLGFLSLTPIRSRAAATLTSLVRLKLTSLSWILSVFVFAIVGWALNLYVRYSMFALPVLALGMGVLLARLWDCGRWGRPLAFLLAAFFAINALVLWQYRINYGLK